ncbi:hypothetical protein KUTeg_023210 [Tegillarca granosa]|uniref:Uncharacterized protein n=1 Tax=Tegillarca granosa TaxID=220873 RepID=A0ABQ9E1Z9_TEGGR|nr:hypothetical protein KUTeg_023210 [Tegillarca granosa]
MACMKLYPIVTVSVLWGNLWNGQRICFRCNNFVSVHIINKGRFTLTLSDAAFLRSSSRGRPTPHSMPSLSRHNLNSSSLYNKELVERGELPPPKEQTIVYFITYSSKCYICYIPSHFSVTQVYLQTKRFPTVVLFCNHVIPTSGSDCIAMWFLPVAQVYHTVCDVLYFRYTKLFVKFCILVMIEISKHKSLDKMVIKIGDEKFFGYHNQKLSPTDFCGGDDHYRLFSKKKVIPHLETLKNNGPVRHDTLSNEI